MITGAVALGAVTLAGLAYAAERQDPGQDWARTGMMLRRIRKAWMRYWRDVAARSNAASPVRSGLEPRRDRPDPPAEDQPAPRRTGWDGPLM